MHPTGPEALGLGLWRGSGAVTAGTIRTGPAVAFGTRLAVTIGAAAAIAAGAAIALGAGLAIAVAAGSAVPSVSTVAALTAIASITAAATAGELGGDQLVVLDGTSDDLERLDRGTVLGLGCEDRHDLRAVERELDVGPQLLSDRSALREQLRPEYALGLLCSGGTPAPRAIGTVTGQLDVDPARHRGANLLGRPTCSGRGSLSGLPGEEIHDAHNLRYVM